MYTILWLQVGTGKCIKSLINVIKAHIESILGMCLHNQIEPNFIIDIEHF